MNDALGVTNEMATSNGSDGGAGMWHAAYTRHQHEKVAAHNLEHKGFEVFLPLYSEVRRWKDRKKKLYLPVFPCYVFLRGLLGRRLDVLTTPGVHSVVGNAGYAAVVPQEEIEAIRRVLEVRAHLEPCPYLRIGDRARVKTGPLRGLEGILLRKRDGSSRLILSIELLRRSVAVEVDEFAVEKAAPKARWRGEHWPLAGSSLWTPASVHP